MESITSTIKSKKQVYDAQLQFHLNKFEQTYDTGLKVHVAEIPEEYSDYQLNLFLLDKEVYPEDYATFSLLVHCFKESVSTEVPEEADFILLPFNLYFYEKVKEDVDDFVAELRSQYPGIPFLFFFISDFCLRPIERSVRFEKECLESIQGNAQYFPFFIEERDKIIHFESTIDLLTDIGIFPLIAFEITTPNASARKYLFSFMGEYYKHGWPEDFVRGEFQRRTWERLAADNKQHALIASIKEIKNDEKQNLFEQLPSESVFTLCPRGIANWSFRVFESILCGSIPVILSDSYVKPFSSVLAWDTFSLTFAESQLQEVDQILLGLRPEIISYLQSNLARVQHYFTLSGLWELLLRDLESAYQLNSIQKISVS